MKSSLVVLLSCAIGLHSAQQPTEKNILRQKQNELWSIQDHANREFEEFTKISSLNTLSQEMHNLEKEKALMKKQLMQQERAYLMAIKRDYNITNDDLLQRCAKLTERVRQHHRGILYNQSIFRCNPIAQTSIHILCLNKLVKKNINSSTVSIVFSSTNGYFVTPPAVSIQKLPNGEVTLDEKYPHLGLIQIPLCYNSFPKKAQKGFAQLALELLTQDHLNESLCFNLYLANCSDLHAVAPQNATVKTSIHDYYVFLHNKVLQQLAFKSYQKALSMQALQFAIEGTVATTVNTAHYKPLTQIVLWWKKYRWFSRQMSLNTKIPCVTIANQEHARVENITKELLLLDGIKQKEECLISHIKNYLTIIIDHEKNLFNKIQKRFFLKSHEFNYVLKKCGTITKNIKQQNASAFDQQLDSPVIQELVALLHTFKINPCAFNLILSQNNAIHTEYPTIEGDCMQAGLVEIPEDILPIELFLIVQKIALWINLDPLLSYVSHTNKTPQRFESSNEWKNLQKLQEFIPVLYTAIQTKEWACAMEEAIRTETLPCDAKGYQMIADIVTLWNLYESFQPTTLTADEKTTPEHEVS